MTTKILRPADIPIIQDITVSAVSSWISSLKAQDMFWHLDDQVKTVEWSGFTLSPVAAALLESQRQLAFYIALDNKIDIWAIIERVRIYKNFHDFRGSRRWEFGPVVEEMKLHESHDCSTLLLIYGLEPGLDIYSTLSDHKFFLEFEPPVSGNYLTSKDHSAEPSNFDGHWTNPYINISEKKLYKAEIELWDNYRSVP
jgi:hypothetical protein